MRRGTATAVAAAALVLVVWTARAEPDGDSGAADFPGAPGTTATDSSPMHSLGNLPESVLDAALAARDLPLPERMKAVSEPFLDLPYIADPLGEGAGIDPDPYARYDAFDCMTFVEEVLALSLAGDPLHAAEVRTSLRYGDGPIDYAHRRHFLELQWIPANVRAGWIREATADYGPVEHVRQEITPGVWKGWKRRVNYALADSELPVGWMEFDILPLETAIANVDQIRPGSILLTVRRPRPWVPIAITHVAITVPGDKPTLREASHMQSAMRVRDKSLKWYLEHLRSYSNWPVAGIGILEPIDPLPRRTDAD